MTEPIMLDVPNELTTPRLVLRAPRAGDGERVNAAIVESAVELAAWMPWANPTPKPQDTEVWCRQAAVKFLAREQLHYSLYLKDGSTCIGACGMHDIDWKIPKAEIGYWLRTPHCGKGYMAEAVSMVTALATEQLKIQRVEIRCDERNRRSIAVAERVGFRLEGVLRQDSRDPKGELRSTCIFAKVI